MKNTIISTIGDFFCPYYCISCGKVGGILCGCCKKYITSGNNWSCLQCGGLLRRRVCSTCELPFREQYYIGERIDLLKNLIEIYKYQSVRLCAPLFTELLYDMYGYFAKDRIVSPLPTISKHIRSRGFDHTARLARSVARRRSGEYNESLVRKSNTVQVGASAELRKKQAALAYTAKNGLKKGSYLLVDDVWTTGSSMKSACVELKKVGIQEIAIVVLAKSE